MDGAQKSNARHTNGTSARHAVQPMLKLAPYYGESEDDDFEPPEPDDEDDEEPEDDELVD
jgi:hypothetical protein